MNIHFTKMHGLGNDFIVVDAINQSVSWSQQEIATYARRDTGIGFDQCLFVEASNTQGIDFNYRIFNADGQEVAQCGNGARCLALFVVHYGLTNKKSIRVKTLTTEMTLTINANQTVSVDTGPATLLPANIPMQIDKQQDIYTLTLSHAYTCKVHTIALGNPHAVMVVDDIAKAPVTTYGKEISTHPLFPAQINAGFMQIIANNHIKLRVYERGSGETKACGSGAMAAAAIGRLFYNLDSDIKVSLPGGDLLVHCPTPLKSLRLTGPATFVYEGVILPNA